MAAALIDRIARFVTRAGKRVERFTISAGAEQVAEVPSGDGAIEELAAAAQDAADAVGRAVTVVFRAYAGDACIASLTAVVRPQDTAAPQPNPATEYARVIQLLSGHAQELTRLIVASQQAILAAYQSALRDAARRAAEAEARAEAAEVAAVEAAATDGQLPPAVERLLESLPAIIGKGSVQ